LGEFCLVDFKKNLDNFLHENSQFETQALKKCEHRNRSKIIITAYLTI